MCGHANTPRHEDQRHRLGPFATQQSRADQVRRYMRAEALQPKVVHEAFGVQGLHSRAGPLFVNAHVAEHAVVRTRPCQFIP
jgi:hypothetical protein